MQTKLHKNARTTLAIRREIQQSPLSAYALSKKYDISWSSAKRWKEAETLEDRRGGVRWMFHYLNTERPALIAMHDLPGTGELGLQVTADLDSTAHAEYFDEVKNRMAARMALPALTSSVIG